MTLSSGGSGPGLSSTGGAAGVVRVAVVGKGGSGKTTLVALMARAFAERGSMVLAVDLDVNPGLAESFGLSLGDTPLPDAATEERAGAPYGWSIARHLTAAEAVRRYGVKVAPRIVYLGFGNIARAEHPLRRFITAVRQIADEFEEANWVVLVDLGAGPTGPFEGHARRASLAIVVAEPTAASLICAERLMEILQHDNTPARLVVTQAHARQSDELSHAPVPFATVPFDPEVQLLERSGSLQELTDRSPALDAVRRIVSSIAERLVTVDGGSASDGEVEPR